MTEPAPPPADFRYTAFYCEENVWHLAQHPAVRALPRHVLFISNPARMCPLWSQRAARRADEMVLWDYHVVLVARDPAEGFQVWDLDTRLGLPVALGRYLDATFRAPHAVSAALRPHFRVLDAEEYTRALCSDRAHMRASDGAFVQPPPPWPPIGPKDAAPNLARFVDTEAEFLGRVVDLDDLRAQFAG